MAKVLKVKETKEELKQGKEQLYESLDETLANVKTTKDELEQLRENLKGMPEFVLEREVRFFTIRKKLSVVLQEKGLHDSLDAAIQFLDDTIELFEEKQAS